MLLQKLYNYAIDYMEGVSGTCGARAEWPGMEQSYPGMEGIWQQK